eukprot:gene19652-6826_t
MMLDDSHFVADQDANVRRTELQVLRAENERQKLQRGALHRVMKEIVALKIEMKEVNKKNKSLNTELVTLREKQARWKEKKVD